MTDQPPEPLTHQIVWPTADEPAPAEHAPPEVVWPVARARGSRGDHDGHKATARRRAGRQEAPVAPAPADGPAPEVGSRG